MITHRGFGGASCNRQPPWDRIIPGGDHHRRFCAKAKLVAALLAIVSGAACGGGGAPSIVQPLALPSAQVLPGTLTFANQNLGTTSASQPITLSNTGTAALTITGIGTGANFGQTSNCAGGIAAGGSCMINVTFSPTAMGPLTGMLTITDNRNGVTGSTQTVSLSGTGTGPIVSMSGPGLGFVSQVLNTTSTAQTETLTNTGTANLTISTVTVGGANASDFAKISDTCTGATVTPNSACTVSVTFTPMAMGSRSASLSIADNAGGSPQTVSLTGTGVPSAQISPSSVTFAGQAVGVAGTAQTVTLTNIGTAAINISGVNISGDFSLTNNCSTSLGVGSSCSIQVVFTPTAMGTRYGTLSIGTSATTAPQTVSLMGTGNGPLAGVFTQQYDNGRSGANTQEAFLTASNVNVGQFGKLFSLPVDGQVYAQPLYMEGVSVPNQGVHNVIFVATEHDSVYAFDADGQSTTVPLWHVSFVNPSAGVTTVPNQDVGGPGYSDLTPEIGITSTPVIDPAGGTVYLTAKTKELQNPSCPSNCTYNYFHRLHALDITTGAEKFGGPVVISASVPGTGYDSVNGTVTFGALQHLQRPALLLLNGIVYIGFGSHGDFDPYHGWLMAYNATNLQQVAVFNVTPNAQEGAIWQSGGGISADSAGYVYVVTANGTFDVNSGGIDYGDSVLKMQIQSGQFQVVDYFTPANQAVLASEDLDLGSSPALILPDQTGSTYIHLLAIGGKDGRVWILNRDNLGQIQTNDVGAVQILPELDDSLFGGGAYWNGNLYFQEVGDYLNQFPLENDIAQTPLASESEFGGFPNCLPVVSANGTSNAVLWLVQSAAYGTGGPALLYAFDATDVSTELYNSAQASNQRDQAGPAVKFVVPTVANGKVYVGAAGEVDVFGPLP